nr:prolyl endopeptidase-like [Leptinotarsa decemlineata]
MHYLSKILSIRELSFRYFRKSMSFNYPDARRDETVKDNYFGIEVADPYRWLEDPDSEETRAFVDAQNAITKPFLQECPYKDQIKDEVTKLWNYPKLSTPYRHGNKYYQYRNTGLQNQSVIFVQNSLDSEGTVFLDPNTFSEDGTVALSGTAFSEDGSVLAYGISSSGSDWIEIKFRNVETGKDYDEVLKKVKYSRMTWMHDNKGFFYGGYLHQTGKTDGSETKSSENQKLYYHKLGTDQSEDVLTVEFEDQQLRMGAEVSDCGNYLVITPIKGCKNNLLYFSELANNKEISGKLELTPIITEFVADFEYITNTGTHFLFRTNKDAPNYRIVVIDFKNPSEENWIDLISEHSKDVLDWAHAINMNMIVVCYLRDVKNAMAIHDLKTGKKIYDFKLDLGTISAFSGKRYHKEMFYSFGSFLTPNIIYKVNFDEEKIKEEVMDVCKKLLLHSSSKEEYGDNWHNGGRFEQKQNCFDDFQYAAKFLVKEKYTSVEKLTIQGGSNGGLLVAACLNQAPELFGAAICQVGVLDMLRYHKFTIGYAWKSDYGCSDEEDQFKYLYKYSPLHNIQIPKDGTQYPATLLLTADHDDRVVPLHSLKFIAELQYKVGKLPTQKNPLFIRIETRAGHGAGKPTSKIVSYAT